MPQCVLLPKVVGCEVDAEINFLATENTEFIEILERHIFLLCVLCALCG